VRAFVETGGAFQKSHLGLTAKATIGVATVIRQFLMAPATPRSMLPVPAKLRRESRATHRSSLAAQPLNTLHSTTQVSPLFSSFSKLPGPIRLMESCTCASINSS